MRQPTVKTSVRRRLWMLVAAFLAILGTEAWLSLEALQDLASLSEFRAGLEDWSRTRSAAAAHLHHFLDTGDPAEWQGFLARMEGLEGFEGTRLALAGKPDAKRLRESLARQGASDLEARRIAEASRELRSLPRWSALLDTWRTAARRVADLRDTGSGLEARSRSGALDPEAAADLHRLVDELDRELESLEGAFSDTLRESREALERRFQAEQLTALGLLGVLVLGLGLWTSLRLDREMDRRQEVEQALSEHQERLHDILEHSTNLFYSHGPDHRLTYVSPRSREFLGCEPEEALKRWTEFVTDHPNNSEAMERTERAIRTGERQPPYELQLRRTDGEIVWVEVHEAPVIRDGRTVAVVGALTDVTKRKRAEEERKLLEERLREVERLEAVGRLAGGVAHDFNNLLTAILGHCDLATGRIDSTHPAHSEVLEVKRVAGRAARLTRQLLAISRRQAIEPRILDLNRAVDEGTSMLRRLIGEDVRLELSLRADPATVLLDPCQVDQLLMNLAVNSRDAMPKGGRIAIETDLEQRNGAGPGDPVDLPAGDYVVLTVSDSGEGMGPVTRQHAFEPFFTTKERGKGTGLGLATVYGIVKQNDGFIALDSEPGAGTTFRIFLPRVRAAVEEETPRVSPVGPGGGSATVLLVEDEPAVRALIRRVLAEHGYSVLEAAEGTAALALFEEHQGEIDLLVTDLVLPGISGDDLASRIGELRPDVAKLFISGYPETVLGERGVVRAGIHLLHKPFSASELLARVGELTGAHAV